MSSLRIARRSLLFNCLLWTFCVNIFATSELSGSDRIGSLLELAKEGEPGELRRAIHEIAILGPRVRSKVAEFAKLLPFDHAAKAPLEKLAVQLANTVIEPKISENSVELNATAKDQIERLKGRPLTAESFLEFLLTTAADLPAGAGGVSLAVARNGKVDGMSLVVEFTPKTSDHRSRWETFLLTVEGNKQIGRKFGVLPAKEIFEQKHQQSILNALHSVFSASPDAPVMAKVQWKYADQ